MQPMMTECKLVNYKTLYCVGHYGLHIIFDIKLCYENIFQCII